MNVVFTISSTPLDAPRLDELFSMRSCIEAAWRVTETSSWRSGLYRESPDQRGCDAPGSR